MRIEKSAGLIISEIVTKLLQAEFDIYDREETPNDNISIGVFTNCRECGHTYMVIARNGNLFTWCVYEHRNSDKIIINGKEGCICIAGDLPYCSDNKNDYLASFNSGEYKETALKLKQMIVSFLDSNKKSNSK